MFYVETKRSVAGNLLRTISSSPLFLYDWNYWSQRLVERIVTPRATNSFLFSSYHDDDKLYSPSLMVINEVFLDGTEVGCDDLGWLNV